MITIVSFVLYTLGIVILGLYSARYARRSDEDFFLAGRSLGPWVGALSASASSESGWVTLGLVGWAFTHGVQAYWIAPGCLLGYLFNWFVIAPRMSDRARALNALTLPDFFAFNFRERVPLIRILSVIVILVAMLAYVSGQLAAAGKAFEAGFGGLDYRLGVLIGGGIVLLYTVSGGFRAVCWTDFLQALLMVGTLVIFPIYLLMNAGGYGFIFDELRAVAPEGGQVGDFLRIVPHLGLGAFIGFLFGHGALGINFGYPGQPHVLVRFMALREKREAWIAGLVAFTWGLCVYWGAVTIGLFARAFAAQHARMGTGGGHWTDLVVADGDLSLVVSAMNLLPEVLSGLVLAAVLAAICSTADSQLVVAASSAANDLYARLLRRSNRDVAQSESGEPVATPSPEGTSIGEGVPTMAPAHPWVNRGIVAALGVIAVLLVIDQKVTIYTYVLTYGWAMLGASFGPQVVLGLLWKRASWAGCLFGMLTGFVIAIAWPNVYNAERLGQVWPAAFEHGAPVVEVYNLPLAFVLALIVNVVVSLLVPSTTHAAINGPPGAD